MSTRQPPSSPGRGSNQGGPSGGVNSNRNRGANAANRNRRGHSFRLNSDGTARARKKNAKRAPRWEREGDNLYAEVTKKLDGYKRFGGGENDEERDISERLVALAGERIDTADDVRRVLKPWTAPAAVLETENNRVTMKDESSKHEADSAIQRNAKTMAPAGDEEAHSKGPPFMWGPLPVGPVLAQRLLSSQRSEPTSVQRAAFPILTAGGPGKGKNKKNVPAKRTNAIIASPTGTGKTLAYLLPLLCTSPGGQIGEGTGGVLIVTPTIELACQIQREVDVLWPTPSAKDDQSTSSSSLFVVGVDDKLNDASVEEESAFSPGRVTLQSIGHAPLIAGTPKMLRMLYREAGRIADPYNDDLTISKQERDTAQSLISNLRSIVLDEADRLLRTEAVAREAAERKARKVAQRRTAEAAAAAMEEYLPPPPAAKKRRLVIARPTQTELLLRDLPVPSLSDVQIVCASATVGRTMRRQLMQILDAPSADAAATLITGDGDLRVKSKDADRRKSVLLPERLTHAYRIVLPAENEVDEEQLVDASEIGANGTAPLAERNEAKREESTLRTLQNFMFSMKEAKPILIFPGRVGVERVQLDMLARGLTDVRTLRNLDGEASGELNEEKQDGKTSSGEDLTDEGGQWKSTPVYIIGERFARGLDLPDVEYVVMLSPPSSAAGYAHMAGRTGRNGRRGVATTLVRPKNNEVQRLATIADTLGLKFDESPLSTKANLEREDEDESNAKDSPQRDTTPAPYPWGLLSEPSLLKKKNAELYEYLISCGKKINKQSKKSELVSAIQALHSDA